MFRSKQRSQQRSQLRHDTEKQEKHSHPTYFSFLVVNQVRQMMVAAPARLEIATASLA